MGLEDKLKDVLTAPFRAARSLYDNVLYPVVDYVKDVVLGYTTHTIRTIIGNVGLTSGLIRDQQKTFDRNLKFDVIKDLVGLVIGSASLLVFYLPGAIIVGASLVDLAQNGARYVINKASNSQLRPAPLWLELSEPWIWLSAGHAAYNVGKCVASSCRETGVAQPQRG